MICIKSHRYSRFCTSQAETRKTERSQLRQIMMKDKHQYTGCPRRNVPNFGSVPYVKVHRYNPKHIYPKLNSYGDNGQRKGLLAVPNTATCTADRHVTLLMSLRLECSTVM
jgi:hypothetical protein